MATDPGRTKFAEIIDELRSATWLPRSFFTEFEFPAYTEKESGKIHRAGASLNHVKAEGSYRPLTTLDQLFAAELCKTCWDTRFEGVFHNWGRWRDNTKPPRREYQLVYQAHRMRSAIDELEALREKLATAPVDAAAFELKRLGDRAMPPIAKDHQYLSGGYEVAERLVDEMGAELREDQTRLLDWARDRVSGHTNVRLEEDLVLLALAILNDRADPTARALIERSRVETVGDQGVVCVMPRFAVVAVLCEEVAGQWGSVQTAPAEGLTHEVIEAAAYLWTTGEVPGLLDAVDGARAALAN